MTCIQTILDILHRISGKISGISSRHQFLFCNFYCNFFKLSVTLCNLSISLLKHNRRTPPLEKSGRKFEVAKNLPKDCRKLAEMLQKIFRSQKTLYITKAVLYWISGIIYQISCVGYQVMVVVAS
jgi:hypothetical protein